MTTQVAYNLNPEPQLYPTYTQAVLQLRPIPFLNLKQRSENKEKARSLRHVYLQLLQTQ